MADLRDLLRDAVGTVSRGRYGEQDPYVLALAQARSLGYPAPGSSADEGEAQRYMAAKLAAERWGGIVPLVMNPLHEAVLSWVAEGEGSPSLKRLLAGYRGTWEARQ